MKIVCEVCRNMGQLQHLSENYFRVKHYLGSVDGKLKFEYHKQSPQYVQSLVSKPSPIKIDPIDPKTIDPKLEGNSLISGSVVRSPGFEPGITSLEGLCPKPD